MTVGSNGKQKLKVLITVKTYPIPSAKYDELVCTAGVTGAGDFIRLYPINFRDLPFSITLSVMTAGARATIR